MARRKVYIVKSGSLHKTTLEYWLTPSYHSSKKGAMHSANQTLEINRAKEVQKEVFPVDIWEKTLFSADYVGEEGKYKGRIIVEWAYMNEY
jgi:hypothetical protein